MVTYLYLIIIGLISLFIARDVLEEYTPNENMAIIKSIGLWVKWCIDKIELITWIPIKGSTILIIATSVLWWLPTLILMFMIGDCIGQYFLKIINQSSHIKAEDNTLYRPPNWSEGMTNDSLQWNVTTIKEKSPKSIITDSSQHKGNWHRYNYRKRFLKKRGK